jgi:hypothetical protein
MVDTIMMMDTMFLDPNMRMNIMEGTMKKKRMTMMKTWRNTKKRV